MCDKTFEDTKTNNRLTKHIWTLIKPDELYGVFSPGEKITIEFSFLAQNIRGVQLISSRTQQKTTILFLVCRPGNQRTSESTCVMLVECHVVLWLSGLLILSSCAFHTTRACVFKDGVSVYLYFVHISIVVFCWYIFCVCLTRMHCL